MKTNSQEQLRPSSGKSWEKTWEAGNFLLDTLPAQYRRRLVGKMKLVQLPLEHLLFRQGDSLKRVYFPTTAVVSLLNVMQDSRKVEVATVGREGMVGMATYYGSVKAFSTTLVQREGEAYTLSAREFLREMREEAMLRNVVEAYCYGFLIHIIQSVGCHAIHTVEQRFTRWILAMADRAVSDTFPIRHELMAMMLSVLRQTVGLVASELQRQGLIVYKRGKMTILNRPQLETLACECYWKGQELIGGRRTTRNNGARKEKIALRETLR
jgi:CRP-like cAMP-binding protein